MTRQTFDTFVLRQFPDGEKVFTNDLVARLPGLVITQFQLNRPSPNGGSSVNTVLRFDFTDDWYSVLAFLDAENNPTAQYLISAQTPLQYENGVWRGDDLILKVRVQADWSYTIEGTEEFWKAVDAGWMDPYKASNAQDAIRRMCAMLNDHALPPEVMDAMNM